MTGAAGHRPWRGAIATAVGKLLPWIVILVLMFPLVWTIMTSLKSQAQNLHYPPIWVFTPTFTNYRDVFIENPLFSFLLNSVIVGVGSTALALLLGCPAAYAIARRKWRGIGVMILAARLVPGVALLVPWYIIFRQLGLLDTYTPLILTHLIVSLPIVIWLMVSFFEDLPSELEDAARIDGCSYFGVFIRISLPLTVPGLVAATILAFIYSWNNFLFSLILSGRDTAPLPVAVFNFMTYGMVNWGGLAAAATVILTPVALLTLIIQKHIARGMTAGAIKG